MSSSLLRRPGVLLGAVLLMAAPARAQEAATSPPVAPRKGPRLQYEQGPAECLNEKAFRQEVAIALDGVDHFDESSPDLVRVWFEKVGGGYRGTIEYTGATGAKDVPEVQTSYNCELLARWVASSVSDKIPRAPAPPPCAPAPAPPPATAPAPGCSACPVCGTSQPPPVAAAAPAPPKPPPWRMDLSVGLNTYVMMTAFLSANVGPAVGIAGEVRGEIFGVSGEFRAALPSRAYSLEPIPGATSSFPTEFDLSQISALVVPCARWKFLAGCAVGQFGVFLMKSTVAERNLITFGVGPRLGFEVPFAERFAAFGFGEVLFVPSPGGFRFDAPPPGDPDGPIANTRWRQPVASAFFAAGFSVKFR